MNQNNLEEIKIAYPNAPIMTPSMIASAKAEEVKKMRKLKELQEKEEKRKLEGKLSFDEVIKMLENADYVKYGSWYNQKIKVHYDQLSEEDRIKLLLNDAYVVNTKIIKEIASNCFKIGKKKYINKKIMKISWDPKWLIRNKFIKTDDI